MICFIATVLLLAVAAAPTYRPARGDLWGEYLGAEEPRPPYDPPDLGPKVLDKGYLRTGIRRGLTDRQRRYVGRQYEVLHAEAVRGIFLSLPAWSIAIFQ